MGNRLPKLIEKCAPPTALKLIEKAYNLYPECTTILTNEYLSNFKVIIKSLHVQDNGEKIIRDNCEIITIDLSDNSSTVMCCYKFIEIDSNIRFLSSYINNFIYEYQHKMFIQFHQDLLSTKNDWINLTLDDIRELESKN